MEKTRTNVVLPRDLVKAMDKIVGKKKRSDFLALAAQEKLARINFGRSADAAFGAWKDEEYPFLSTEEDVNEFLAGFRAPAAKRLHKRNDG
ncbi:MAG: hypothetical protein HYU64_19025 [Armatimonadetes bacterium]|nr:hypothetical protein [Armatimonadota bacterium]